MVLVFNQATQANSAETTETAHLKRPRPKRPTNFQYDQNDPWQDQNGPQLHSQEAQLLLGDRATRKHAKDS